MRNKQWIKAGLLTATLIGLASPALARPDDDNGWQGRRGGGEARNDNGGGNRGDNGGNRGGDSNRQQTAPPAMEAPRAQRDFVPRPAPEARAPAPAPAPVAAAPDRNNWAGQGRSGSGWQNNGGDRRDRDGAAPNRGPNGNPTGNANAGAGNDWRNRGDNRGDDRRGNDARGNDGRGNDWRNNDNRGNDGRGNDWRNRNDGDRNWGDRDRDRNGRDWRPGNNRPPVGRPPVTNRWQGTRPWNNDWRRDQRYNWQYWRNSHRDIFRLPNYYAPYGWGRGYFRFSIGAYLDDILFGSSYWIDDPWRYRLPPVYGTLRWVRYYDDALLVDIRDGYVVDIIYDVFW